MYSIVYSTQMKRSLKLMKKRGKDLAKLQHVINILASGEELPQKYKDHCLSGNYSKYRECHIEPDWLLIYKIENDILVLTLVITGSHSDLF